MGEQGERVTITPREILDGGLPEDVSGVRWPATDWTECREHLLDPSWLPDPQDAEDIGFLVRGEVACDMCRETLGE